jgi:hypothetical protein
MGAGAVLAVVLGGVGHGRGGDGWRSASDRLKKIVDLSDIRQVIQEHLKGASRKEAE